MARLADLLAADEVIIATSQDFDQYPSRTGAHYWGMVANVETGVPPPWPTVGRRRIFAYVKPHFRDFARLLEALRLVDAAVVVHAPGVSTNDMHRFTAANIAFSREPVRMADVRRDCNIGICHAGGTASTLVTAGRPVLLLPQHLEQMMMAKRVQQTGACLVVDFEKPAPDYRRLVERLLAEPSFTTAAGALAQRYADDSIANRIERIVDRMEALMTQGARGRREAAGEAAAAS
jgi:UDP:flavonoid glycosyltransferase YjiC (YdhE family)